MSTGVSANVRVQFCHKVAGQTENDMVLDTSAYKNGIRATTFTDEDLGASTVVAFCGRGRWWI
jgi:S-DNA-T family DNA segregation ATPase FtsK/SpoIIIE